MKRFILPVLILFCYPLFAQTPDPGMMPRWGRFKDYLQNGTMTLSYKTFVDPSVTGTLKVVGNSASTNFYVVSDADSFKVRMFKYLYPLEIEIGNVQKAAIDSAGNAVFAGTVSAAAFSPTATSTITAHEVFAISDGDSIWMAPHQDVYAFKIGIGGTKMFAVDTAGAAYAVSFSTPTAALTAITGSALSATAVSTKMTVANNYPFVSNSTVTVDSLVTPRLAGVLNATEVKTKLNIAANYPLTSSSSVAADTFTVTAGNMCIIDIDSVATAGSINRWLKITVSKAGATGIPVSYWVPADTATVK